MVTAQMLTGMPPREAIRAVQAALEQASCPDADFDARELVLFVLGGKNALGAAQPLTSEQGQTLAKLAMRREQREPLQYLVGSWDFLRFTLHVGPGVLCPRADTETVAEQASKVLKESVSALAPRVLDLCAGTGALGLGIKSFVPQAQVICVEKSPEAFRYLEQNLAALVPLGIAAPAATAVLGDVFCYDQTVPPETFDAIVSNPPYLTGAEMLALQPEVACEPAMALDGGADGLAFYRAIAAHYLKCLKPGGLLALEIGWQQAKAVTLLLQQCGWENIRVFQDFGGNDRCVLANRSSAQNDN